MWILNVGFAYESWFTKICNIWIVVKKNKENFMTTFMHAKEFYNPTIQYYLVIEKCHDHCVQLWFVSTWKAQNNQSNTSQEY